MLKVYALISYRVGIVPIHHFVLKLHAGFKVVVQIISFLKQNLLFTLKIVAKSHDKISIPDSRHPGAKDRLMFIARSWNSRIPVSKTGI